MTKAPPCWGCITDRIVRRRLGLPQCTVGHLRKLRFRETSALFLLRNSPVKVGKVEVSGSAQFPETAISVSPTAASPVTSMRPSPAGVFQPAEGHADFGAFEPRDAYEAWLRQEHGLKQSFRSQVS